MRDPSAPSDASDASDASDQSDSSDIRRATDQKEAQVTGEDRLCRESGRHIGVSN